MGKARPVVEIGSTHMSICSVTIKIRQLHVGNVNQGVRKHPNGKLDQSRFKQGTLNRSIYRAASVMVSLAGMVRWHVCDEHVYTCDAHEGVLV